MFKEIKELKLQKRFILSSVHSMAQALKTENVFSVGDIKKINKPKMLQQG